MKRSDQRDVIEEENEKMKAIETLKTYCGAALLTLQERLPPTVLLKDGACYNTIIGYLVVFVLVIS